MALITSDVSFRFLENKELKSLWNDWFSFSLPNRRNQSQLLDEIESQINLALDPILSSVSNFVIETDGWTNISNLSFNALLAHGLTPDFKKLTICLGVAPFDKTNFRKQTAVNLAADLKKNFE